jgi:hypothetical protein
MLRTVGVEHQLPAPPWRSIVDQREFGSVVDRNQGYRLTPWSSLHGRAGSLRHWRPTDEPVVRLRWTDRDLVAMAAN